MNEDRNPQRETEIADIAALMSTEAGRRFAWRLLGYCGVYESSYAHTGPYDTYFNEGRRNIGLWLLSEITTICPSQYIAMQQEKQVNDDRNPKRRKRRIIRAE